MLKPLETAMCQDVEAGTRTPHAWRPEAHGPRGIAAHFHTTREWVFDRPVPADSRLAARGLVESGLRGTRFVAVMGPFIEGIQTLRRADLPLEALGPALAVMLLVPFCAACLKLLYWGPLQAWLEQPGRA